MTVRVLVRRATALLSLAFVAGCGADKLTNLGEGGAYTLVAPTAAITTPAGSSGSTAVTFNRTGNFAGVVTLAVTSVSDGVTASVTPGVVTSNVASATVDYAIAANATAGAKTITIVGTSPGQADQTVTVTINVGAAQTFTFAPNANALTLTENDSVKLRATVGRVGGFAGVVDYSITGLPAGVTANFKTIAGDTASITLRAAAGLTGGTYNIQVTGYNAALQKTVTTTIPLTVVEVPGYNLIVTPIPAPPFAFALPLLGSTLTQNIHVVRRGGYSGAITYALTGAPATGVVTSFTQTGDDATITYTADAAAPLSTNGTLTLTASAPNLTDRTVPIRNSILTAPLLTSGTSVALPAGDATTVLMYAIYVPKGGSSITFTTTGPANADVDIYTRLNNSPANASYSSGCTSEGATTNETCTVTPAAAGVYFIRIDGFTAFSGVSLKVTVAP